MPGQSDPSDLMSFVSSIGGGEASRVEENLGEGYVRLRVAEAERRQAKHDIRCIEDVVIELLRNARDAGAHRVFVATSREGTKRMVVVLDDGGGIPEDMWGRVFDARVTSKLDSMRMDRWGVHGRGMALYSIRENAVSARVMDSGVGLGTSIRIVSDAGELGERADQSTWPESRREDGHIVLGKGPHNIVRTCCEFALEERDGCSVYVGSPAEIIATIRKRIPATNASLKGNGQRPSVLGSIALAEGPRNLSRVSQGVGLEISERTAQRIVSGEIAPLSSVARYLSKGHSHVAGNQGSLHSSREALVRFSREDTQILGEAIRREVETVASRYYVHTSGSPKVSVRDDKLHITIQLVEDD